MQLYSLEQIKHVLLQAENILEKVLRSHLLFTLKKDVMKTEGKIKQTYFVKKSHVENLKLI